MTAPSLAASSERIMGAVITICALAVCAFVLADSLGAIAFVGWGSA